MYTHTKTHTHINTHTHTHTHTYTHKHTQSYRNVIRVKGARQRVPNTQPQNRFHCRLRTTNSVMSEDTILRLP